MPLAEVRETGSEDVALALREGRHRDALASFAKEHGEALGRFAMASLGDQAEAEDAVREALLAAHDALPAHGRSVRTLLFGMARTAVAKRLATSGRQDRRRVLARDVEGGTPPDARAIRLALEELRPTEREALLLRYVAGLTYREVADVLGLDEPSARTRVSRSLARLRTELGEVKP